MIKVIIVVLIILGIVFFGAKFTTENLLGGRIIQIEGTDNVVDIKPNGMSVARGKVEITNFRPNREVSQTIGIHNSRDTIAEISLLCKNPDQESDGYVKLPDFKTLYPYLIKVEPQSLELYPDGQGTMTVSLLLPEGMKTPPKWEFWVQPVDQTNKSMVQAGVAIRWCITMKEE